MSEGTQQLNTVTAPTPTVTRIESPKDVFEEVFGAESAGAADVGSAEKGEKKKVVQKNVRQIARGCAYIQATYNNTMIVFTDPQGNVIASASSGQCGFKGPKKSTAYAAGVVVRRAAERSQPYGLKEIEVFVKGVGSGREAAVRALNAQGLVVIGIHDTTPIPHNGCRAPKIRRV
ncbi:30S ribosomal protein S11 [Candidatus Uhrbacteria bacterium]|nr:30S ribosomal protein S11 [Candidatus Uhrbacteria bacterium]